MSHAYIVESVEVVVEKSALPPDDNTELDELLHQKALQRTPPCALQFLASNPLADSDSVYPLPIPPENERQN